jgi:hypothetical protein
MNPNIKSQKIVGENEMDTTGGIVYDMDLIDMPMSLPNPDEIIDQIIIILECMSTPEMCVLRETNVALFEELMEEKFIDFSSKYFGLFSMIIKGEDITPLFTMLEAIGQVNSGNKSLDDAEKNVGQYLNKFLPEDLITKMESGGKKKKNKKKHRH